MINERLYIDVVNHVVGFFDLKCAINLSNVNRESHENPGLVCRINELKELKQKTCRDCKKLNERWDTAENEDMEYKYLRCNFCRKPKGYPRVVLCHRCDEPTSNWRVVREYGCVVVRQCISCIYFTTVDDELCLECGNYGEWETGDPGDPRSRALKCVNCHANKGSDGIELVECRSCGEVNFDSDCKDMYTCPGCAGDTVDPIVKWRSQMLDKMLDKVCNHHGYRRVT
jgi:hypothetical protein